MLHSPVRSRIFFITGTDTGVGKTVLTCLLARRLRRTGKSVAALKPLCSGGRGDAHAIRAALDDALTLDQINPWHFRAPLAPVLAARQERRRVTLGAVTEHIRRVQEGFEYVIVEGAGGLLSPLGERFDSRDVITALRSLPIVVSANRLGAINQVMLVLSALPLHLSRCAPIVLVAPRTSGDVNRYNLDWLSEFTDPNRIHALPWMGRPDHLDVALRRPAVRAAIDSLISPQLTR